MPVEQVDLCLNYSKKQLLNCKKIIREEYGRSLSFAEVSEIAYGLVGYFDVLAKIASSEEKINV